MQDFSDLFPYFVILKGPVKLINPRRGTSILGGRGGGGLTPNFASEIHVGAPNFASKDIGDRYPKFCPLNFKYNPKWPPV